MKIAVVCCTFLRPKQLGYLIQCFLKQDYPAEKRELVILDDTGEYDNQRGNRWQLISTSRRFSTLGDKRNAATALVSDDVEAVAVWDDDDFYLPWALRASVAALKIAPWSRPSLVMHLQKNGLLKKYETTGLYHAGWAYSREVFERVGGYPSMNNGEDQGFSRRLMHAGVLEADPIQLGWKPFYIYSWGTEVTESGWHLSGMGTDGYQQLGDLMTRRSRPSGGGVAEKTRLVITNPPHFDLGNPRVLPGVHPRSF